jgi:hypothetical protein
MGVRNQAPHSHREVLYAEALSNCWLAHPCCRAARPRTTRWLRRRPRRVRSHGSLGHGGFVGRSGHSGFSGFGTSLHGWRGYGHGLSIGLGYGRGLGYYGLGYGGFWPGYIGGAYYPYTSYGSYGYTAAPNVIIILRNRPAATQTIVRRQRSNGDADTSLERSPAYFLIAAKDGAIYSAAAYWVEDETLHFITTDGRHDHLEMAQVDRALSQKLNQSRRVAFGLPPPRE